ncbi:MAG: hypothetical protein ACK4GC_14815 [Paracoccaceae bacterium]
MAERRRMTASDWLNSGFNLAAGLFLGLAVNGLAGLVADGTWQLALIIGVVGAVSVLLLFAFDGLVGGLIERIFPSGVRPARSAQEKDRKPLARLLSLPAGIALGVVLARLGLSKTILGLF